MSPVAETIRDEIRRNGPIGFDRFMEIALYLPEYGYYTRKRDPFGRDGDFVTASQVQPIFGRLIAAEAEALCPGEPVWELGPGRGEMAAAFGDRYHGIEVHDALPANWNGFVFANEFFDALPVRVGIRRDGEFIEQLVGWGNDRAIWVDGTPLNPSDCEYVKRYWPRARRFEIGRAALDWIERFESGAVVIVDYGYVTSETIRFPDGTLMGYRRQRPIQDVLASPGECDITAHIAFDALQDRAIECGFEIAGFETLAQFAMRVFQTRPHLVQTVEDRRQLKTLMVGMGENFRVLRLVGTRQIGIGSSLAATSLPHHRTCGSAYGGSAG